jgi:hypothetical protein
MFEMVRAEVDAVLMPVMLLPAAVSAPERVCAPMVFTESDPMVAVPTVALLENRFVEEAVVVKNVVDVALPSVTFWLSWYATEVVE